MVRQLLRQCKESFDSLVKFFGENPQALANDAVFWVDVITFVNSFTVCQREVFKKAQVQLQYLVGTSPNALCARSTCLIYSFCIQRLCFVRM